MAITVTEPGAVSTCLRGHAIEESGVCVLYFEYGELSRTRRPEI